MRPDFECNVACGGNTTLKCGAADRISLYGGEPALGTGAATGARTSVAARARAVASDTGFAVGGSRHWVVRKHSLHTAITTPLKTVISCPDICKTCSSANNCTQCADGFSVLPSGVCGG